MDKPVAEGPPGQKEAIVSDCGQVAGGGQQQGMPSWGEVFRQLEVAQIPGKGLDVNGQVVVRGKKSAVKWQLMR